MAAILQISLTGSGLSGKPAGNSGAAARRPCCVFSGRAGAAFPAAFSRRSGTAGGAATGATSGTAFDGIETRSPPSCPRLSPASTSSWRPPCDQNVDGGDKPGHDSRNGFPVTAIRSRKTTVRHAMATAG